MSSCTRFANSALYSSAIRPEYLLLVSELDSSADPPCLLKKSVADPFPPTFMVRSCPSCQLSRLVDLCKHG